MPTVTLNFSHNINVSVQIGDIAYYVQTIPFPDQVAGQNGNWASTTTPHMTRDKESIRMIGPITSLATKMIVCEMDVGLATQYGPPQPSDFIMFSKDNKANLSSLLGYYCLANIKNNSTEKAELFGIGADFIESSK